METRSAKRKKIAHRNHQITAKGAKKRAAAAIDRISDLPDAILHRILFLLPIKCIAQMSVLSKRWRFLWATFPDLDFTTISPFTISSNATTKSRYKFSTANRHSRKQDFITQVLSIRDKNSDIRVLCFRARLSFSRLNNLIRTAIRQNVRILDVEVATEVVTDDYFNFPRCIIGSHSLKVLKLKSGFRLPPSSIMRDGFRSLQTLSLSLVILYNQPFLSDLFSESSFPLLKNLHLDMCFGLKYLCVGCKALEDFSLEKCFQLQGLDISCPKLEKLKVASCFDAYSEKSWVRISAPKLQDLVWHYNAVTDMTMFEDHHHNHHHHHQSSSNSSSLFTGDASVGFFILNEDVSIGKLQSVNNFLSGLSHARSLILESQTIEVLSNNKFFIQPFYSLKSLELHTGFNKSNVQGLACLFRSSPTLHTLILKIINDFQIERKQWNRDLWDMTSTEEEQYWESQIPSLKPFLQNLKVVKIHGFLDCENEVTLAKFLLKHGKALEEMQLCAGQVNARDTLRRQKIRSQMMGFSWASSNAKVAFQ